MQRISYLCSDPNNDADSYLKTVKWPLYTEDKKHYLEIGKNMIVKSNGIYPERFKLWDLHFPIPEMLYANNTRPQCRT